MSDLAKTFVDGVRELVETTATRVAEGVLTRALAAVEDLRARGSAFVTESEALAPRVRAALAFVESAQKAGAVPFIGAADRTDFAVALFRRGLIVDLSCSRLGAFDIRPHSSEIAQADGRYTVVVSLYKQGGSE